MRMDLRTLILCFATAFVAVLITRCTHGEDIAGDWSYEIEEMNTGSHATATILVFGNAYVTDSNAGVRIDKYRHNNTAAEAIATWLGLNVSDVACNAACGWDIRAQTFKVWAAANRDHYGATWDEGAEALGETYDECTINTYLTPQHAGVSHAQIVFEPPQPFEQHGGPIPDWIQGYGIRGMWGNTFVQWVYTPSNDRWTRSGQVCNYNPQTGENEITQLANTYVIGWRGLTENTITCSQYVEEFTPYAAYAGINNVGSEWTNGVFSVLMGTGTTTRDHWDVHVDVKLEIE